MVFTQCPCVLTDSRWMYRLFKLLLNDWYYSHIQRLPGWPLRFHFDDCQDIIPLQKREKKWHWVIWQAQTAGECHHIDAGLFISLHLITSMTKTPHMRSKNINNANSSRSDKQINTLKTWNFRGGMGGSSVEIWPRNLMKPWLPTEERGTKHQNHSST